MTDETADRQDEAQQPTTDARGEQPVVGFELTLGRDRPAECTLFLAEAADGTWGDAWITAEEGAFVDLESSR